MRLSESSWSSSASGLLVALSSPSLLILWTYLATCAALLGWVYSKASSASGVSSKRSPLWKAGSLLSLASTWYFMLAFLRYSYVDYVNSSRTLEASTLRRLKDWLDNTRLFEQAWLRVVQGPREWWFSSEICVITTGAWTLWIRARQRQGKLRYAAAYMILGQIVAISVAAALSFLAVAEDTTDASTSPSDDSSSSSAPGKGRRPQDKRQTSAASGVLLLELVFFAAGAWAVSSPPRDLLQILTMHVFPLFLVLLPPSDAPHFTFLAMGLSIYAAALRIRNTLAVLTTLQAQETFIEALWNTFWAHPAQGSISSDHVAVSLLVSSRILLECSSSSTIRANWSGIALASLTPLLCPACTLAAWVAITHG
ncbi:hypothetical protein IE81DRAFT_350420 [Ceraceosorus guamensis]|uniref:Uncharacterized protein n=1 Tax=Ceraceosorus guamensis TaxID=1522189 RepID=A0A316VNK3_9BASI|nr:hypothetical protein IE81DRAFT_350420 [Ceraceosorus guamensis]PWN39146.1 hypothetical protein IE81DRAFT_350420 [Ceraceosorus guamensis]